MSATAADQPREPFQQELFVGPRRTDAIGAWITEVRVLDWDGVWWHRKSLGGHWWPAEWTRMKVIERKLLCPWSPEAPASSS